MQTLGYFLDVTLLVELQQTIVRVDVGQGALTALPRAHVGPADRRDQQQVAEQELDPDLLAGGGTGSSGRLSLAHSGGIHRPASGIATSRSPKGRTWSPE